MAGGAKDADAGTKYMRSVFIPGKRGCGMGQDWTYKVAKSKRRIHQHRLTLMGDDRHGRDIERAYGLVVCCR